MLILHAHVSYSQSTEFYTKLVKLDAVQLLQVIIL